MINFTFIVAAADRLSRTSQALMLRFLQTLTEIATEKKSTIVFPLPIEILKAFTTPKPEEKK